MCCFMFDATVFSGLVTYVVCACVYECATRYALSISYLFSLCSAVSVLFLFVVVSCVHSC